MALLNNDEAVGRILALRKQILAEFENARLHYKNLCCDLCGDKRCVQEVAGFVSNPPKLCLRHGCGWNSVWMRHGGDDVHLVFAKWLSNVVLKEARKCKKERA